MQLHTAQVPASASLKQSDHCVIRAITAVNLRPCVFLQRQPSKKGCAAALGLACICLLPPCTASYRHVSGCADVLLTCRQLALNLASWSSAEGDCIRAPMSLLRFHFTLC